MALLHAVLGAVFLVLLVPAAVEGAWPGKVTLERNDRVGFMRQRKVGSTLVDEYMMKVMDLCVNHCEPNTGVCQDCMYATECGRCRYANITLKNYETCYPCPHSSDAVVRKTFSDIQKIIPQDKQGKLYMVTVMREPFDMLLSYFFYLRSACNSTLTTPEGRKFLPISWLMGRPFVVRNAICSGNFNFFINYPSYVNTQMQLILGTSTLNDVRFDKAMEILENTDVVLDNAYLREGLMLLDYTFSRTRAVWKYGWPTKDYQDRVMDEFTVYSRKTVPDPLREQLANDPALRRRVEELNHYDYRLYAHVQKRFHNDFQHLKEIVERDFASTPPPKPPGFRYKAKPRPVSPAPQLPAPAPVEETREQVDEERKEAVAEVLHKHHIDVQVQRDGASHLVVHAGARRLRWSEGEENGANGGGAEGSNSDSSARFSGLLVSAALVVGCIVLAVAAALLARRYQERRRSVGYA